MTNGQTEVAEQLQKARQRLVVDYLEASRRGPFKSIPARPGPGFRGVAMASLHDWRRRLESAMRSRAGN